MPVPLDSALGPLDEEEAQLRSVALQNAASIVQARQRAEQELRRAQEALRESQERLQAALGAAGTGTFRWDLRTGTLDWDENMDRLLGLAPGSGVHTLDELLAAVHPADRERVAEHCRRAGREGVDLDLELRVPLAGGEVRWLAEKGRTFFGERGEPLYVTGAFVDITRLKRAEETLRTSEEQLRCITDAAPALISYIDASGRYRFMNRQYEAWFGHRREELIGTHMREALGESAWERIRSFVETALAGESVHWETEVPYRDAGTRFVHASYIPDRGPDGSVRGFYVLVSDISERRRAEEALQEETRVLELLNDTGTAIAGELDLRALVQKVTDAATALSGARAGAFFYDVVDESGESFTLYALSGAPREASERFGMPRNTPVFDPTFRGHGVIRSDDIAADPRYGGQLPPHHGVLDGDLPVRSYLAMPVKSRTGEVIGGLFFGHPEPGMFTARSERLIGAVAAQAGIAIDNARLYQAAQRAAEERTALLESERTARNAAERMSEMKDEFLATLSHELRTPLNAIVGWAHVLRQGTKDAADLAKGLDTIERNARMQAQLIEDLLDMSRITSGKMRLDVQTIQPLGFVQAALDTVRPALEAKGIRLDTVLDPAAGPISGDPSRLQQVVWNLLSNAIKFTPRGGRVQVVLKRAESHVEIVVTDSGAGIRPEFIAHLFERFRQADATTTRKHGGLGLGLSIVKHLLELHGGTVQVTSPGEGQGTTVTVYLPVLAARRGAEDTAAATLPSLMRAEADLRGVKVLVVDDQEEARELIRRVLEDCRATVVTAGSAAEALTLVERERPDLLVSDIGMPEADGFELLRRVRALGAERGGRMPAIALTAFARSEDRTRALRAGFLVHVAKPVDPAELVATVATVTGRVDPLG
jgi:PAS domain S-box-containing protein